MKNILVLISAIMVLATSATAQGEKQAIIFVDPSVTYYESRFQAPRIDSERDYYEWILGYTVTIQVATEESIVAALLDGQTKAISFFGHGNGPDAPGATSTMLLMPVKDWQSRVYMEIRKRLAAQGVPTSEARTRATEMVQNFGLEMMRNHSCSSLIDTDMAEVFVRGGGSYFGSPALYSTCPTPTSLFSDTSWLLEEYIVPFIATRDMHRDPSALCERLGPADGCLPGSANCLPCPGTDSTIWYDPSLLQVQPAE